jgi:hypothetical protein
MNNYINFTSTYNPNLQVLNSADGDNAVKMNEMFGQIMGNIAAVQSSLTGSLIDVRSFAPGDGSDQTAQIKAFFDSAQEGDVLLITGNRLKYEGTWWAVHLDIVNNTVEGNIIRDNMLMVTPSAVGRYLFGASPWTNGKNVVVDLVKDNNGTLYQLVNEIVMMGPNSTRWRITIDAKGDLKTTKL